MAYYFIDTPQKCVAKILKYLRNHNYTNYHYYDFEDSESVFPDVAVEPGNEYVEVVSVSESTDEGDNPLLVVTLTLADETRTVYIHYTQPAEEGEEGVEG